MANTAGSAALSPAQLQEALWVGQGTSVYAAIDGGAWPDCAAHLKAAEAAGELVAWDCLLPGALAPQQLARAPWLAALRPKAAFNNWLLGTATSAFPDWGLLAITRTPMLSVRSHLRSLTEARTPGGRRVPLRVADPAVLTALLPTCSPSQLEAVFGPLDALVVPGAAQWTWFGRQSGGLAQRVLPVLAAPD